MVKRPKAVATIPVEHEPVCRNRAEPAVVVEFSVQCGDCQDEVFASGAPADKGPGWKTRFYSKAGWL